VTYTKTDIISISAPKKNELETEKSLHFAGYSSAPPARGTPTREPSAHTPHSRTQTLQGDCYVRRSRRRQRVRNLTTTPLPGRPRVHTCPNPLRQNTNRAATALHDRLGEIPTPNSFRVAASRLIPARSSRRAPRRHGHAPSNCQAYGSARSCRHPASPPLWRRFLRARRGRSGVESRSIAEQRVISSRAGEWLHLAH
jgi:hypothetical protein